MDNNKQTNKKHRFSLSLKLNLTSVLILLAFLLGILFISYQVQKNRIQEEFYAVADKAAVHFSENTIPSFLEELRNQIDSETFEQIREQAVEANDSKIISDWLKATKVEFLISSESTDSYTMTLQEIYDFIGSSITDLQQQYDISRAYNVYMKDGKFFYLAWPPGGLLKLGTQAPDLDPESSTEVNGLELFPARLYRDAEDTYCRAVCSIHSTEWNAETERLEYAYQENDAETYGFAVIDIDMQYILKTSYSFLHNVLFFMILLTAICIALNIFFVRRLATKPLKELTEAACSFGKNGEGYSMENVINVDIHSNDEIHDLYREIQAMQTRIVNYTDDLTRLTAEKARSATEMQLAASIQNSMLKDSSKAFDDRKDFKIAASMNPARAVGGDFYDFFLTDEDHLALIIADVSGKGIPAALFMMAAMLLIKSHTESGKTPGQVLETVNNEICQNNSAEMFVTVWIGILDLKTGLVTCANAGHENPVILDRDGQFSLFKDPHGLVVGAMSGMKYKEYELKLEPGNVLFVYTDGLPEAGNASGEFYGTERIISTLNTSDVKDPASLLEAITKDVDNFVGEAEQFDDLTMLCVKV